MSTEEGKISRGAGHRPYDEALMRAAVAQWQGGARASQVAEWLGITTESLRVWWRQVAGASATEPTTAAGKLPSVAPSTQELHAEVRRLRAQLQSVTSQHGILKKAVGILSAQAGALHRDQGHARHLFYRRPVRGLPSRTT